MTEDTPDRARTARLILIAFAVLGALIAVGGASAMIYMRGRAPNDAFEAVVPRAAPLVAGDAVTYKLGTHTCTDAPVLEALDDGRVTITSCDAGTSRPITVERSTLRLFRFPRQGGVVEPFAGDVVLVQRGIAYQRAEIVAVEASGDLRVRPVSDASAAETIVPRGSVYLVRKSPRRPRS